MNCTLQRFKEVTHLIAWKVFNVDVFFYTVHLKGGCSAHMLCYMIPFWVSRGILSVFYAVPLNLTFSPFNLTHLSRSFFLSLRPFLPLLACSSRLSWRTWCFDRDGPWNRGVFPSDPLLLSQLTRPTVICPISGLFHGNRRQVSLSPAETGACLRFMSERSRDVKKESSVPGSLLICMSIW